MTTERPVEEEAIEPAPSSEIAFVPEPQVDTPAAGPRGVVSAISYTARTAGLIRGTRALLKVNQTTGFDCPGCAWPDPDPRERSVAEFCENGARAVAHEADKRVLDRAMFTSTDVTTIALASDHELERLGRIGEPYIKRAGKSRYEPISYDEAFKIAASALKELASPNEAAFYTSGRTSNEAAFLYQLFVRAFGTNNLPDCSNMCHESSGKGLGSTLGIGKGTVTLHDFEKADLILVIGQNPGTNHPRMLISLVDAAARGAKIVSINPLYERGLASFAHPQRLRGMLGVGAPVSTHYVRVRINGDVALLKGVMRMIFDLDDKRRAAGEPGVIDRAFIAEHSIGFDDLEASIRSVDMGRLERDSGIDRKTMRELAELYCASERVIACWAMGLTQHKNGVANVREIVNLLLLRGNVGRDGAGVCPVRGHSNVQGDRTVGIHEAPSEAFLKKLEEGTGVHAPREHGLDTVATISALEEGRVKVFIAMGGNFVAAAPDTDRTARALAKTKLSLHVGTKLNRTHLSVGETSILLPCLSRSERDEPAGHGGKHRFVTVENSMGIVHASEGRLSPVVDGLRSEPEIVAGLAHATLGDEPVRWRELAEDYDLIRDLIEKSVAGFERYNARVREPGGFYLPNGPRERRFTTKSGKAHFTVQDLPENDLTPDQLLMMTIRSHDQFNTTVYDLDDRYRGIRGERRVILMNAEDMRERGLEDGALLDITSHFRGEERTVTGFKAVSYDIPLGCAATYFPETNPLVPLEHHADESHTPASKSVVITVSRS
ncbi:MAG: FdhF/YdeP family oxidoreductase [Polyangiaceae bacterium]